MEGGRDPGANDACPTVSLPQSQSSNNKDRSVGRLARVQMMLAPRNQPLDRSKYESGEDQMRHTLSP